MGLVTVFLNFLLALFSADFFRAFLSALGVSALVAVCICIPACQSAPPVEAFAGKFVDQVVGPAVQRGLEQGVRDLNIQAGAQGINPKYVVDFNGKWVVGVEGSASVGVDGIAGQVQVSSSSDEETSKSPAAKLEAKTAPQ
jgi:hypothetical protein